MKTHFGVQSSPCLMTLSASLIIIMRLVSTISMYLTEIFKLDVLKVGGKKDPKIIGDKNTLYKSGKCR